MLEIQSKREKAEADETECELVASDSKQLRRWGCQRKKELGRQENLNSCPVCTTNLL